MTTQNQASERLIQYLDDLLPSSVLCIGQAPAPLLAWCRRWADRTVVIEPSEAIVAQLERRFDVVLITMSAAAADHHESLARLHTAVQHLERDARLIVLRDCSVQPLDVTFRIEDLTLVAGGPCGDTTASVYQRGPRFTVHDLLYEARSVISRVTAQQLQQRLLSDSRPLLLDTRTQTDRARFGVIHGSVHVPRTVVEWHLDPANGYLHPAMTSFEQPVVVMCNGGYSSSLSAANLRRLGFRDVADLIGGFQAWRTAGLPWEQADHSHLDLIGPTPDFT